VRKRRANPDDSILSALIAAEEEGDRLSSGEIVRMAFLLLVAGFETLLVLRGFESVPVRARQMASPSAAQRRTR
jgi:cytochrome P450